MTAEQSQTPDPDELPAGTLLEAGAMAIEACIGRGGVATVYRVRTRDGRRLALKMMVTRRASDEEQQERFHNEWRIQHALRGVPYVVEVDTSGRFHDGRPWFTMELLESPTLADLIVDREVTVRRACWIMREVANALDDLHARGVIHRDIKPDNIAVDSDRVRLLDFGYAYTRGSDTLPSIAGLTRSIHRPGTPLYMAPEQADGASPVASFDLYALAVTMYETLVGHAPNSEIPAVLMMAHKCRGGPEELSIAGRVYGLPKALVELVDHGLRRDPQQRVATAAEFRDRLDAVLEQLGDHDQPAGIQDRPVEQAGEVEEAEPPPPDLRMPLRAVVPSTERLPRESEHSDHDQERGDSGPLPLADEELAPNNVVAAEASFTGSVSATASSPGLAGTESSPAPERNEETDTGDMEPARASVPWPWRTRLTVVLALVAVLLGIAAWIGWQRQDAEHPSPESVSESPVEDRPAARSAAPPEPAREPPAPDDAAVVPPADVPPPPPAVEAEPDPVSEPEVERPRRRPDPSSTRRQRGKRTPSETPLPCTDVEAEAKQASRARQWTRVLSLTKSPRCWDAAATRDRLRVKALHGSKRFAECVKFGSSSGDPEVRRLSKLCAKQIEEKGNP